MPDITKLRPIERTIENCEIISIPAGAAPKYVVVQLPGGDGARVSAWWPGFPAIAVNDFVTVRHSQAGVIQFTIVGTSGATAARSGSGWPFANVITVSQTDPDADYATIQDAIDAASDGAAILIDPGTYTENLTLSKAVTLIGLDPLTTIITSSTSDNPTIDITADGASLVNLSVTSTAAGTYSGCVSTDNANIVLDNCILTKSSGAATNTYGFWMYGAGSARLTNCRISVTSGTNKYGLVVDNGGGTVTVEDGQIGGSTQDIYINHASATVNTNGVRLTNNLVYSIGTLNGNRATGTGGADTRISGDVFPQGSANGLNARFERLFGDDKPANSYKFTGRLFTGNDFVSHRAGFEDSQLSPYSFGGSPGGFSVSVPTGTSAESASYRHHLLMRNQSTANDIYLQWTDSTAKTSLKVIMAADHQRYTTDTYIGEIRLWDVQSPGAGDNYYALRFQWKPVSFPSFPLRVEMWYGTGVTFGAANGTLLGVSVPFYDGLMSVIQLSLSGGGTFFAAVKPAEPTILGNENAFANVGYPSNFKTAQFRLPAKNPNNAFMVIDEVVIT